MREAGPDSLVGFVASSPSASGVRDTEFRGLSSRGQGCGRAKLEMAPDDVVPRWGIGAVEPAGYCAACGHRTWFDVDKTVCSQWQGRHVPWWTNTLACRDCGLAARMRAAVHLFEERIAPAPDDAIYITEQITALYHQLQQRHSRLIGSEYIVDSTPRGATNASGIRCEDLTALTFPDARFDHLLSFEVLEHIPDYKAALHECARVLKPGGKLLCSVPFHGDERHIIRARVAADGSIEHLLPPEYHGDPVNPDGVLCFRYFGLELLDDLRAAGFTDASAWIYWSAELGYLGEDRVVFVAVR